MEDDIENQSFEDESGSESAEEDDIQIDSRDLQQALLDEEKNGTSIDDIRELWDSTQPMIGSAEEGVSLFTTYIYILRRLGASVDDLKCVFLEGQTGLKKLFGDYWDENAKYRRNFAYFLYTKAKQADEALNIWKNILSTTWDADPYMWIEAVRMERHFGSIENARSLLYQGANTRLNQAYDFFEYFLQFEREEGTREQVDLALEKINEAASRQRQNKPRRKEQKQPPNKKQFKDRAPTKRKADDKSRQKSDEPKKEVAKTELPIARDNEGFAIPSIIPLGSSQRKPTIGFSLKPRVISTNK